MIPMTARQLEAVRGASRDRSAFASACDTVLYVGGKDYSRFVEELRTPEQDGPAVVLEGKLFARLMGLEHEECRLEYVVNGERITAFLGEVMWLEAKRYRTSFLAATPSYRAKNTPLGTGPADDLSYADAEPSSALYEAAARLGYPGVEIARTPRPLFTRTGDAAYRWTDSVSEVYEEIEGEAKLVPWDTPLSVFTARPESSVAVDAEPVWVFEEGRDFDAGELSVGSREEGSYASVVAWRALSDGSHQKLAQAGVDNRGRKVRKNSTFFVELTDLDANQAHEKVYQKALELADNAQELSFPTVYPPFHLTRGDPVLVRGREITAEGTWTREYRARLTSVAPDAEERKGSAKAVGGLSSETFVVRKAGTGVPRVDARRAFYGFDHLHRLRFSSSLGWARRDGHLVLDSEGAATQGVTVRRGSNGNLEILERA